MINEIIIVLTALLASGLTFISGFGLGTLLLPAFALFFPVEIAVGMTAVVHSLNSIFKFGLVYKHINRAVLIRFGLPGILGAFIGARFLIFIGQLAPFSILGLELQPVKSAIGLLMLFFALTELFPKLLALKFSHKALFAGGLISGFFGGFSGHQGALRSMFLLKLGMSKEVYVATGVAIALLVDLTRIPIYIDNYFNEKIAAEWPIIVAATTAAFVGALAGKRLLPKITQRSVHILVAFFMIGLGLALFFNWL
jgi:uncharacterized membrane protein YfcA